MFSNTSSSGVPTGALIMNAIEQQHFDFLYEQHLINLKLQGKRPASIDAYSRAIRRITTYFNRTPDTLTTQDLKQYFNCLIQTHSWSTIKLDRNDLQFFYRYTLNKQWEWLDIVVILVMVGMCCNTYLAIYTEVYYPTEILSR